MFSKSHANTLPTHQPYDLKIELEDGATPPFGPIYSLSLYELQMLREFIDEHLANSLIHLAHSPSRAPVLFIKKKDSSLQLCVSFRSLNNITKKDWYLLPWITDLLESLRKAQYYFKIDLRHAYHSIWIHEGDEWKTAFHTCYGSVNYCAGSNLVGPELHRDAWRGLSFNLCVAPPTDCGIPISEGGDIAQIE